MKMLILILSILMGASAIAANNCESCEPVGLMKALMTNSLRQNEEGSKEDLTMVSSLGCPGSSTLYYSNGRVAGSSGSTWYWPNGRVAGSKGSTWHYSNGRVAGSEGSTWYHANGRVAGSIGSTWYHANGRVAGSKGSTWYYANGRVAGSLNFDTLEEILNFTGGLD